MKTSEVVEVVARVYAVSPADILGKSRIRGISHARSAVYYWSRRQGQTTTQIARAMNRDHTTVATQSLKYPANCVRYRDPEAMDLLREMTA